MTIYRSLPRPASGLADDPDDVMCEYQRIAHHFMKIDQNNVRASGVERQHIVNPSNIDHEGLSDFLPTSGALTYAQTTNAQTLTMGSDDGAWRVHPGLSLTVRPRTDSWWLVAVALQGTCVLTNPPAGVDFVNLLVRAATSSGTPVQSIGTGIFTVEVTTCAIMALTAVLLPAGESRINLQMLGRWRSPNMFPDITINKANMWAVGFYDA